ncbi:hypothetical protein DSAG12_02324 [Promethearchaeum syntrophicum]|uniref:Uncharacterized protein n=1 Tax=Promethearchaeum syntrophicum TaxID=2594042 RepID=A0A5B9DBH9_9ARCH|nr:hypothetical protein [Candidatus Prometheoarchaeum syntrophicum]QEE16494.1 hypothetical protein DSAG12_02324 [Candidatus Prometheoarchaeum syntrophicum]
MTNAPDIGNKIKKIYHCPICKKTHEIFFQSDFANNRSKYPFSYVFLHKYENSENIEDKDKEILTTIYVDAQLNIRGVEALLNEDDTNILSKDISKEIIGKLTRFILELQDEHEILIKKFNDLEKKCEELSKP